MNTAANTAAEHANAGIGSIMPFIGDLTFKLVRDTRFSRDKSPYNPAFRAHISSMGKLPIPVGYFIMIKPGNQSFLGGVPPVFHREG